MPRYVAVCDNEDTMLANAVVCICVEQIPVDCNCLSQAYLRICNDSNSFITCIHHLIECSGHSQTMHSVNENKHLQQKIYVYLRQLYSLARTLNRLNNILDFYISN